MTEHVLVIGDCIVDETRGDSVRRWPGGAGLNLAVGLRVLGVPSVLAASVGADADGDWLRRYLRERRVELLALPGPHGTGLAVSERSDGEPRYRFNTALLRRRLELGPSVHRAAARAGAVAVNTFSFDDVEQAEGLRELLRRAGRPVVLDPNPRPALLRDRALFRAGFEALLPGTALLKISDEDVALLYPGRSPEQVGARLLELGAELTLLTRGGAGASLLTRRGRVDVPVAAHPGPVVDTMGAGDATLAVLLAHLLRDRAVRDGAGRDDAGRDDAGRDGAGRDGAGRDGAGADVEDWLAPLHRAMAVAAATCRSHGGLLALR